MPQTFVIDQAASFTGIAFLSSAPRLEFGSDKQDRTRDGLGKWQIECVAGFRDQFGNASHEVIKVNVAAANDPGAQMSPYTPVQLVNFVVGVVPPEMRKDGRGQDVVRGGTVWYRADEIRPTQQAPAGRPKASATEG
ncbi:hypothetical protein AB0I37_30420 [Micromonospora purpureochromogenes]|uniref:hypothetical protein n=1 Tax=Actinomycetes TaxID=1760 RepID=UPI0033EDED4B